PGWLDRLLPQMHVEGDPAALDAVAIMAESTEPRGRRSPRAPALWAAVGVMAACASAFVIAGPEAALLPAAALSAVCGGLIAVLPLKRREVDWGALPRALSFVAGAALMAFVAGIVSAAGAPDRTNGWLLAWSVAITGVLILVAGARSIWIPAAFGGIALVVARMAVVPDAVAALSGQGVGVSQILSAALLPGLLALLVATVGRTFSADRRRGHRGSPTSAAPPVLPPAAPQASTSVALRPAVGATSSRLSSVGLAEPSEGPPPTGDPYQRFRPPPDSAGGEGENVGGEPSGDSVGGRS
ncbi:MAG: family transporter, partial [Actinomycetota bacterium]|nr:family transporter [Actinomycetota bacterium]